MRETETEKEPVDKASVVMLVIVSAMVLFAAAMAFTGTLPQ